jgi:hypothetical protein
VPPAPVPTALADIGLLGLTPPFSELDVETELLTAAKTTRANDMPVVEPKDLESEAPWTEILETRLFNLSVSTFFFCHASSLWNLCSVDPVGSCPLYDGTSSLGDWAALGSGPGLEP